MKIKSLHIKNFKSIVDLTINEPNPFTVFVGPNGSGKSNIFEALEFIRTNIHFDNFTKLGTIENLSNNNPIYIASNIVKQIEFWYGGRESILNRNDKTNKINYECLFSNEIATLEIDYGNNPTYFFSNLPINPVTNDKAIYEQFFYRYSRIFVNQGKLKIPFNELPKLNENASNLDEVVSLILIDDSKREDFVEWLQLFIPEFVNIIIEKNLKGENEILVKEKATGKYFPKHLLSDGTYNIIALLTAVYQSDEPQFLCIEEPENGLHPKVIKQLVNFFRDACEEKGHYIWLNTHSQTLVSVLEPKEIILVDKKNGETKIKQFDKDFDMYGFVMDEAWLTNALGGGLPW